MRPLLYALLLANLLFFGWTRWIDKPLAGHKAVSGTPLQLAPAPGAAPIRAAEVAGGADQSARPSHCASLGPLIDTVATAAVATALRARNLNPRERQGPATVNEGYWVYVDHLGTATARTRALQRLSNSGVRDAAALPDTNQVSVGVFSSREGADQRAKTVRAAGLEPVVEARTHTISAYWLNVQLAIDIPPPAVPALVAGLNLPSEPAWSDCPGAGKP
ncbi:MAG TPA: hypothetical protein VK505_00890 [Steroidobacteraceae bacterium]|nr:hypothetical protein [Steroidobacteraceae bacterium]